MGLRRVRKYLIKHVIARIVYIISAIIICLSLIVEVIMIINILLPYMRVAHYVTTTCTHNSTVLANLRDCTVPEECVIIPHTTIKPCIQVYVNYNHTADGKWSITKALVHMNEYNVLKNDVCSYSNLCSSYYWETAAAVEKFRVEYGKLNSSYPCYYDQNNPDRVIVSIETSRDVVLHATLWPALIITLGVVLVIVFYIWVGCDLWGSRIATVMWEKSLKRVEMEQETKRRASSCRRKSSAVFT